MRGRFDARESSRGSGPLLGPSDWTTSSLCGKAGEGTCRLLEGWTKISDSRAVTSCERVTSRVSVIQSSLISRKDRKRD